MTRTRCISVMFMLMLLTSTHSQAWAAFYTGADLIPPMQEAEKADANAGEVDWVKVQEYHAYLYGVFDATEFLYNVPANANIRQISTVVSKYLKSHPKEWSKPAALLVVRALKEAFPLKKSK